MAIWVRAVGPVSPNDPFGEVEQLIVVLSTLIDPYYIQFLHFWHGTREVLMVPPH